MNSDKAFELSNVLKVRFNALMNSNYARYFDYNGYVNREDILIYFLLVLMVEKHR